MEHRDQFKYKQITILSYSDKNLSRSLNLSASNSNNSLPAHYLITAREVWIKLWMWAKLTVEDESHWLSAIWWFVCLLCFYTSWRPNNCDATQTATVTVSSLLWQVMSKHKRYTLFSAGRRLLLVGILSEWCNHVK